MNKNDTDTIKQEKKMNQRKKNNRTTRKTQQKHTEKQDSPVQAFKHTYILIIFIM
jgi:hypothetical protein